MHRIDKILLKMQQQPANISFNEIAYVLTHKGYKIVRIKGSHYLFKSGSKQIIIPRHNPIKPIYIKLILAIIKE